jgi:pimeloyl-ACP methyl ester carboxylesterase
MKLIISSHFLHTFSTSATTTIAHAILFSLVLISLSACSTVKVETRDFIVSDQDLQAKNQKIPTKELEPLQKRLNDIQFSTRDFRMSDGTMIRGIVHRHPNAQATVVLYGNNAFRVAQQAQVLLKSLDHLPLNIIQFDYRGYGRSDGTPSAELLKSDALTVYDQIKLSFPGQIIVHGHSFGSFVAAYVAANRQPDALVLEGTSTSANDFIRAMTPWYAKPFVTFDIEPALLAYDNQMMLSQYHKPLLILVGSKDTVTPASAAKILFNSAPSPAKFFQEISAADHMNLIQQSESQTAYAEFIAKLNR